MGTRAKVRLESNGQYWLAAFYDTTGQRRRKTLGPKSELSQRAARVLCERLAVEHAAQPLRVDVGKAPTLANWLQVFLALKPDLSPAGKKAYRLAHAKLAAHLGGDTKLDRITPLHAAAWTASLVAAELSPSSIANYGRHIRCLFNEAVRQGVLVSNPFSRTRTQAKRIERRWDYVPRDQFSTVLAACPNSGWRVFLGLQRIGSVRRGESLKVTWPMVNLVDRVVRLDGSITKTGQERVVPLDPELFSLLEQAQNDPTRHPELVVSPGHVDRTSISNQHKRFRTILRRAGVAPWEDLIQTLRRNAVQDLRRLLKDAWAVNAIAGHSEAVERKFYLGKLREEDHRRITGLETDKHLSAVVAIWPKLTADVRQRVAAWCVSAANGNESTDERLTGGECP